MSNITFEYLSGLYTEHNVRVSNCTTCMDGVGQLRGFSSKKGLKVPLEERDSFDSTVCGNELPQSPSSLRNTNSHLRVWESCDSNSITLSTLSNSCVSPFN